VEIFQERLSKQANFTGKLQNLYVLQFDATHLPFRDESFNIVIAFEVIEHIANQVK
jgi:ubiquinone/menaquinone biosynthesis C-methylase UbiE